jgi:16S rRNA (cytosine1402-N4)-methyltransferase
VNEELIHTTVLLSEAVDALAIKPDGIYVDCTFGRGGHSALILQRLNQSGRLIALDKDMAAVAYGRQWKDARFHIMHSGFTRLADVLGELNVDRVDGILLDLGVCPRRSWTKRFEASVSGLMRHWTCVWIRAAGSPQHNGWKLWMKVC